MNRMKMMMGLLSAISMLTLSACTFGSVPTASANTSTTSSNVPAAGGQPVVNSAPVQAAPFQAAAPVERRITVEGTGQASGTPDMANITIGVQTQATSAQQAVADDRQKMTALLQTLKGLGIADKDIHTTNYSVYAEQQPVPAGKELPANGPITYRVNNQVTITVRDVSKLGEVLDKGVSAGANTIYGVSFSVANPSTLQADALGTAMADAKARAESLAKLAGVNLGDVISINVLSSGGPVHVMSAVPMAVGDSATPIQPGTLSVNMTVQVVYAIQ